MEKSRGRGEQKLCCLFRRRRERGENSEETERERKESESGSFLRDNVPGVLLPFFFLPFLALIEHLNVQLLHLLLSN